MNPEQLNPNLPPSDKEYKIRYANGFFYPDGMQINWGAENIGFGGLNFSFDNEMGKMVCHSELMGRKFVTAVMAKMIEETIFSDFENYTKQVKPLTLEEADSIVNFKDNTLYTAFFTNSCNEDPTLFEMRWHIGKEQVLNIWFDTKTVGNKLQDPDELLDFEFEISKEKSFKKGFVKAELWSWLKEEKN